VLVRAMDSIRGISSTVLSLRKQAGRRVRLPLASLTVVAPDAAVLSPFEDILRDELNVKEVRFVQFAESSAADYGITSRLTVNARAAGPRLGKNVQMVIKAARAGDWSENDGVVIAGDIPLEPGEYDLVLETASTDGTSDSALALLAGGGFVLLDTATTPALEAEGLARDVVRSIQDTRKAAGFDVSDRIALGLVFTDPGDADAISFVTDVDIAAETLATTSSIHVLDEVPEASRAGTPAEWLPGLFGGPVEFYQEYAKGAFANAGSFTVAVRRATRSIDV
jgi:isoleucyl-tRNA synthetase